MAARREGDTLVVTKLDRLARSLPDARTVAEELTVRQVRLSLGVHKAKGKLRGKQPKLNPRQEAHLAALCRGGEHSTAVLADLFGVARSTGTAPCNESSFKAWPSARHRRRTQQCRP